MTVTVLPAGRYRVAGPGFSGTVLVQDGRISRRGTAPKLQRLVGLTASAFWFYARGKGWDIDPLRERADAPGETA